jgi:ferredoxin
MKSWLYFSPRKMDENVISKLIKKFDLEFNILRADISPEQGKMLVEITGNEVDEATTYLESQQVTIKTIKNVVKKDNDKCIDCGECISLCPVHAISFDNNWSITVDDKKCLGCGFCTTSCAMHAINVNEL